MQELKRWYWRVKQDSGCSSKMLENFWHQTTTDNSSKCFHSITEIIFKATARNVQIDQLANHWKEAPTVFAWPHQPLELPSISMLRSCHQCCQRHQSDDKCDNYAVNWRGSRERPWSLVRLLIHQYSACYHYFCDLDDSNDSSAVMTIVWESDSAQMKGGNFDNHSAN